jgi:hypothetical protein
MLTLSLAALVLPTLALNLVLPITSDGHWSLRGTATADSDRVTLASNHADGAGMLVSATPTAVPSWHLTVQAEVSAAKIEEQAGFSVWFGSDPADIVDSDVFGVPSSFSGMAVLFDLRSNSVQSAQYKDGVQQPGQDESNCLFKAIGELKVHFTAQQGQLALSLKSDKQTVETSCLTVSSS